jgi:DNA-binding protein YbaB
VKIKLSGDRERRSIEIEREVLKDRERGLIRGRRKES